MRIGVTGATGLVGTALTARLEANSHQVVPLVRSSPGNGQIYWNPNTGELAAQDLSTLDGVVHLAGENIAGGRWTSAVKKRIRDSRVIGTRLLCERMAASEKKPRVLICASAIGFYGDRGSTPVDERDDPGSGFLAETCRAWEAACQPARDAGIRVVNLRIGVVLSPNGGALQKMLTPFKLGVGGRVGNGKQYWSWVALDDVTGAILHAIQTETLTGPVNAVSPHAVDNAEFTKVLGKVLNRPTIFPMPTFAARLALGEMADELLLASIHVKPSALTASGYDFHYPQLEAALRHLLGK